MSYFLKAVLLLSFFIFPTKLIAEPDRYTRYLMDKKVDWFSVGMILTKFELNELEESMLKNDAIQAILHLTYNWDRDEFIIVARTDEKNCNTVLKRLRARYGVDSSGKPFEQWGPIFGLAFLPNGFNYSDEPTNLKENLTEKVVINCGRGSFNSYRLMR
jgi:hypothetical protein